MSERITKQFLAKRLQTTTNVMREAGTLATSESLTFEQTDNDRAPWELLILTVDADGGRHVSKVSSNVSWSALCAAVDTAYELAFHARARSAR